MVYQILPKVSIRHKFYKPKMQESLLQNKLAVLNGGVFNGDTSFEETVAALLIDRNVKLSLIMDNLSDDTIAIDTVCSQPSTDVLYVITQKIDSITKAKCPSGFIELRDLEIFFEQKYNSKTKLFINEERRASMCLVGVGELDTDAMLSHVAQTALPRLIPWVFNATPLTSAELAVLLAGMKSFPDYIKAVEDLAEAKQINKKYAIQTIGKLASIRISRMVTRQQNTLDALYSDLEHYRREVHDVLQQIDDAEQQLFSLKYRQQNTEEDDELKDVFTTMSGLELEDVSDSDGHITFVVKTYLANFDPSMMQVRNGYFADSYQVYLNFWNDSEKRIKFLKVLFSEDPVIKLKMMARFKIALNGAVHPLDVDDMDGDYLPNAHLQYYHCLGDNEAYIEDCIKKGDWTMAIGQCISAAGSQNLMESTTATKLFRDIFRTKRRVIELPNGNSVAPDVAYEWLVNNNYIKEGD